MTDLLIFDLNLQNKLLFRFKISKTKVVRLNKSS
jgi:hypothetical protein